MRRSAPARADIWRPCCLRKLTGLRLEHVPYTSISQAVTDIVAGRISVWLATLGGHLGNIQSGRVRALAVSGPGRAPSLPAVPTFAEEGVAFAGRNPPGSASSCPRARRKPIIATLNHDMEQVLAAPAMQRARRPARLSPDRRPTREARRVAAKRDRQMGRSGEDGGFGGAVSGAGAPRAGKAQPHNTSALRELSFSERFT